MFGGPIYETIVFHGFHGFSEKDINYAKISLKKTKIPVDF